jgi:hypothetical protein
MATIAINGTPLEPQPAWDEWESELIDRKLNGTHAIGAYRIFRLRSPNLAGQSFNWVQFDNQVLVSLQTYAPGDLPTGANVVYSEGVVAGKIQRYTSPLDRSVSGVDLEILVLISEAVIVEGS